VQVLLDSEFYSAEIRPLMAQWVLVYLHRNLTQDLSYSVSNADAWRYVQGAASGSACDYEEFVAVKRRIAEGAAGSAEVARGIVCVDQMIAFLCICNFAAFHNSSGAE
jgi:hypothetical protein